MPDQQASFDRFMGLRLFLRRHTRAIHFTGALIGGLIGALMCGAWLTWLLNMDAEASPGVLIGALFALVRLVALACSPILLPLLILGAAWSGRRTMVRLTRRLMPPGRCQTCGYDLRATPDRCPECGRSTAGN